MSDEQYNGFLEEAEDVGILDAGEYKDKRTELISALPMFDDAWKKTVIESIGKETIGFWLQGMISRNSSFA